MWQINFWFVAGDGRNSSESSGIESKHSVCMDVILKEKFEKEIFKRIGFQCGCCSFGMLWSLGPKLLLG